LENKMLVLAMQFSRSAREAQSGTDNQDKPPVHDRLALGNEQ
jgi:hypothetical protein